MNHIVSVRCPACALTLVHVCGLTFLRCLRRQPQGALPYLDIQGMSHRTGAHMDSFHAANPMKPILSTEAATCKTERGVDFDFCPSPETQTHSANDTCLYNNEQAACIAVAVNYSDSREFNAGTFLWAGFDHGSGSSGASGLLADWAGDTQADELLVSLLVAVQYFVDRCWAPLPMV